MTFDRVQQWSGWRGLVVIGLVLAVLCLSGCVLQTIGPPTVELPQPPAETQPANAKPIALINFNHREPVTGEEVRIDGTTSRDPDGFLVGFRWQIQSVGIQTGPIILHTFELPGAYRVELTVFDNEGATDTSSRYLTVTDAYNSPPCNSGGCE